MLHFTLQHEIHCGVRQFWELFFDKSFNELLYRDGLRFPDYCLVEQAETDVGITRTSRVEPNLNMPRPLMKLLGARFEYVEEGVFDKATSTWRFRFTPTILSDKIRGYGTLATVSEAVDRIRRTLDMTIEADVFMLGDALEKAFHKVVVDSMNANALFWDDWARRDAAQ
jgi:hypothetical protein